ncbi:unnamed protein product [Paramecium primaurelia]|uniref:Uncharacterized protein n=1 Tax=Paramecium primaurelia TaxID=5886 RepID=A0A8S1MMH1_PARPR|nr:unnamed protein product [Paramecium primaurelia]
MLSSTIFCLRGGGSICSSQAKPQQSSIINKIPDKFFSNMKHFTNVIVEKSMHFHDRLNKDEIICAFLWFHNHQEYLQGLCRYEESNLQYYDVIESTFEILVKQLIIYLKLSGYLFHYLLQICNNLLRVIFCYQQQNKERYMQVVLKDQLLSQISELEEQIKIESNNIWINGIEFELQMIKICLVHCRTNSQIGQQLAIGILSGIVSSISQLKPSSELIDSLVEAGKYLLITFYDKQIRNPLQIYELYYFFENLKWTILNQLKQGYSVQKTIIQLNESYNNYIKQSLNWIVHFCWINLISNLISYRFIISKTQLQNTLDQISGAQITLNSLIESNHLILIPYDKSLVKVKLFENKDLNIKNFVCLKLFQEYLLSEQQKNIKLLPEYVNFQFDTLQNNPNNLWDLNISLITNEDNLEILSSQNNQLRICKIQIKQNVEQIENQAQLTYSKRDQNQELKICLQDLQHLIKQQKQLNLQLLYLIYEIDIIRIKEISILKALEQIMKCNSQNINKDKKTFQILKSEDLEKESELKFIQNLNKITQLWIVISKILSIYQEAISDDINKLDFKKNLNINILQECEQIINTISNIEQFLNGFVIQLKNAKRSFQKIFVQNKLSQQIQEKISQRKIWDNIIEIYNSLLIRTIISELNLHYSQNWKKQNWAFEMPKDLGNNLIRCIDIEILLKGLKNLINIHQRKLYLLQFEDLNNISDNLVQVENNREDDIIQNTLIQNIIVDLKSQLKGYFEKYSQIDVIKNEFKELDDIEKYIKQNLLEIKKKNWSEDKKILIIITFQKVLNKLALIGLCQIDIQTVQQDILQILDNYLQNKNIIDQSQIYITNESNKQKGFQDLSIKIKNNKSKQDDQFNFEKVTNQINAILLKIKRIKRIIIQNRIYYSYITLVSDQLLKQVSIDDITGNMSELIPDVLMSIQIFLSFLIEQQQIVFNSEKLQQASIDLNIDQLVANLILFNNHSSQLDQSQLQNEDKKCDKIYLKLLSNLENTSTSLQKEGGFLNILENTSYKVREALAYNLITMQAQVQEKKIQEFCINLIKKIWIYEKHPNVRNLLKNKELMELQKKMFSSDIMTFQNRLKLDIQMMLKKIAQLENSVLTENSPYMKDQLQQAIDEFEIYFDNITDMSQRLDINLIFLKEISKDLKNLKSSIDLVLKNVNGIANDIRKLRGKNYFELLLIRKDQILKQKQENQVDQVHIELQTQEYDPITGNKIYNNLGESISFLLKYQYDNFEGEVNEFLWNKQERTKDVMLLKGRAGSGKSRAAINIEELLWNFYKIEPQWIPIYISLPSVKDPKHNIIEQGLESENYNFDSVQIREFKEAVIAGNLNIVLILESYDEMKQDCLKCNLYTSNRLIQDLNLQEPGQNVKIIITTREEILTSIGYQTWFYGKSLNTLKEVELLPFTSQQSSEYLQLYQEISVKRSIKRFYEFLKQLKGQNYSFIQFNTVWCQLQETVSKILIKNQDQHMLFTNQDTEKIIQKIQNVEFFNLFQHDLINSLSKDLLQLWGTSKFHQTINNVNIGHLLNTPFMLEIIVYVLPKMSSIFSQAGFMREVLQINYHLLKKESLKSTSLISKYKQKKDLKENEVEIKTQKNNIKEFDDQYIIELLNSLLEDLESQNFFEQHSIAQQLHLNGNSIISQNKQFNVKFDAQFIVGAFKLNQLTAFDFYNVFVEFYHAQQLQKWKDLGKSINHESFILDLTEFSMHLAIDMSIRQLTQVNYKQKGKLILQQIKNNINLYNSWEDCYFSENEQDSDYKQLLRKCMLITSKGSQHSFNHKSIQEFFVADYILKFLEKYSESDITIDCQVLQQSIFNKNDFNLSSEQYQGTLELLKPKLQQLVNLKQKLIKLVLLSQNIQLFERASSNALYFLSCFGEYLEDLNLNGLQISNTKLNGLTFYKCNLNNTQFDNVSIDSCNFAYSTIEKAKWTNLICKEKPSLTGHQKSVQSLIFIDNGDSLITGSLDGIINIWSFTKDQKPLSRQFDNQQIFSLSYSEIHNIIVCLTDIELTFLKGKDLTTIAYQTFINQNYTSILVSPDLNYIAVIISYQVLFIMETKQLSEKQNQNIDYSIKVDSQIQCIALSQDQKLLAISCQDIQFWNVSDISNCYKLQDLKIEQKMITQLQFSSNNQIFIFYDENDKEVHFWNIKDLKSIVWIQSINFRGQVNQIEFTLNNQYVILRSNYFTIYDFMRLTEQQETILVQSSINIKEFETSRNFEILACIQENMKLSLTIYNMKDIRNIQKLSILIENQNELSLIRFSEDGLYLLCCKRDEILLWNLNNYKSYKTLVTSQDKIIDVVISQDQKTLVSCSLRKIVIIQDFFEMTQWDKLNIIDLSFDFKGASFYKMKTLAILGENKEGSIIQFFDCQSSIFLNQFQSIEILEKVYFTDNQTMITLGKTLQIWGSYRDGYKFENIKQKEVELQIYGYNSIYYPEFKNLLIYDSNTIYILSIQYLQYHKIKMQKYLRQLKYSFIQKFLIFITNTGLEIQLIDNILSTKKISCQTSQDFSISNNQTMLAYTMEQEVIISDLSINNSKKDVKIKNISFYSDQRVCFAKQDQIFIICKRNQAYLYDIQNLEQIKLISNATINDLPTKILFLEKTQQIIAFYKKYITLQNIDNLEDCKIIQRSQQDNISTYLLTLNNNYFGISYNNQIINFLPLSQSIQVQLFQKVGTFKYKGFAQSESLMIVITSDLEIFKIDPKNLLIVKIGSLKEYGEMYRLELNIQQTKLLLAIKIKDKNTERLELIDFKSMKTIQCLEQYDASVHYFQKAFFSEESSYFVTAYSNVTIKLWDLKTCKLLSTFKSNTESIDLISISGKGILAQSGKEVIRLWNLNALRQQQLEFDGHSTSIILVTISSDGLQLASGSVFEIIRWDLTNFQKIDVLLKRTQLPPKFCYSQDCQYFAAIDDQGSIRLWKINTKYLVENSYVICYYQKAYDIQFNEKCNSIIVLYSNHIKIQWDLSQRKLLEQSNIDTYNQIKQRPSIDINHLFTYDSKYLVTFSPIKMIDVTNEKQKFIIEDTILNQKIKLIAISHNNLKLAVQNEDCINLWSIEEMKILAQLAKGLEISCCLAFSISDKVLFSLNKQFIVQLWDVDGQYIIISEISIAPKIDDPIFSAFLDKAISFPLIEDKFLVVYSLFIAFNIIQSDYLKASYIPDKEKVWDLSFDYYAKYFQSAFSEQKQLLAVQWMREFKIFDTKSMKLFVTLEPTVFDSSNYTSLLSFSKSGKYLLSLNLDQTINIWDLTSLQTIQKYANVKQNFIVKAFTFLEDEENIVILGLDNHIYHDHISNFNLQYSFLTEEVQIKFQYIIKDINQYQMKYQENELNIFDKKSGNQIYTLNKFSSKLNTASFSPCCRIIILGMKDGSILFYKIDQETLAKYGFPTLCKSINRFPLLMAPCSKLQNTQLESKESENLTRLFIEKGANNSMI